MSEKTTIRRYGYIIDTFRGYIALGMPLLSDEQALLTRGIKALSTCKSQLAQRYTKEAERLLAL